MALSRLCMRGALASSALLGACARRPLRCDASENGGLRPERLADAAGPPAPPIVATSAAKRAKRLKGTMRPWVVREVELERYVDKVLEKEDMRIEWLPDDMERRVYTTVIRLVLNSVYGALGAGDGGAFIGHRVNFRRAPAPLEADRFLHGSDPLLDEGPVRDFVKVLLASREVNSGAIPDDVEEKLYFNCFWIMFCLIESICKSMRIEFCGHEISVEMRPQQVVRDATKVRMEAWRRNDRSRISARVVQRLVSEAADGSMTDVEEHLYTTMNLVLLNMIEDVLNSTHLHLLEEKVTGSIQPAHLGRTPTAVATNKEGFVFLEEQVEDDGRASGGRGLLLLACAISGGLGFAVAKLAAGE